MSDQETIDSFRILTVCTGNICRSPVMEQVLRARLSNLVAPVTITSAGTTAAPGQEMTPEAQQISITYGGDPGQHKATQLTRRVVERSSLVLTATREHRAAVVSLLPRASRYTFTLNEFARVSNIANEFQDRATRAGRLNPDSVVANIARYRGFAIPPKEASHDDIIDPYRQALSVYDRVGREIDQAIDSIVVAFTENRQDFRA